MSNILEVKELEKNYPGFSLEKVSFELPMGYIMGFIGPNGAGKTTTIKSILGMISTDGGEISLFGKKTAADSTLQKDMIGVVMDLPFYVKDWKVKDVEAAVSPFYSKWDHENFESLIKKWGIAENKKVKELSRGMNIKLMLAVALSHGARLLILDEPTSGLDPSARDELMEIFSEFMLEEDRGILFSTHITSDLEKIADYITFILKGKIEFTGQKDRLMESYFLIKGDDSALAAEQKKRIIGLRRHSLGFEGMISAQDREIMPAGLFYERAGLDDIIVYMNREGREHE